MKRSVRRTPPPPSPGEAFRAWLRALALRAGGISLALLGGLLLAAIASYSVSDPSFDTATARDAQNLLGAPGAYAADLVLQAFGVASVLIAPALVIWGVVAARSGAPEGATPPLAWARLLAAPFAMLFATAFCSALPVPAVWPFVARLGGVLGDGTLNALRDAATLVGAPAPRGLAGVIAFAAAAPLVLFVLGASRTTLDDLRRVLVAIERVTRGALAALVDRVLETWQSWRERDAEDAAPAPRRARTASVRVESDADTQDAGDDIFGDGEDAAYGGPEEAPKKRSIIRRQPKSKKGRRETRETQPVLPVFSSEDYELPPLNLLAKPDTTQRVLVSDEALEQNARMLEGVLADFGVRGEIINVRPGPVVTLYELEPAAGVKSSRVIGLADDIARSMCAVAARVAVVPGRNAIGIELPNDTREMVYLRELLSAPGYENARGDLTLALGKSIGGEPVFADLARMPHLLIAGTTGSGKSVGINTMILSLLYRLPPDLCKLILIDPKMLELSVYEGIPHLLSPVVTEPKKAVVALKWTVREMEERYRRMSKVGVRNIAGFNQRIAEAEQAGETLSRTVHTGYDAESGQPVYETEELEYEPMPFIVVVIDEMADLMMVAGKDIEASVQRLAQMARAAGIHVIMATQRPSVDVITGTIKANFPTRISFQVTSKIDSRTILGEQGAEQLLGQGDMLHMAGGGRLRRVHGAFVSDDEVEEIVAFLKTQGAPEYVQDVTEGEDDWAEGMAGLDLGGNTNSGDALYDKAVAVVLRDRKASTSYIQRRLQIGYNRAASLIERMEDEGLISSANHAGKREILVGENAA